MLLYLYCIWLKRLLFLNSLISILNMSVTLFIVVGCLVPGRAYGSVLLYRHCTDVVQTLYRRCTDFTATVGYSHTFRLPRPQFTSCVTNPVMCDSCCNGARLSQRCMTSRARVNFACNYAAVVLCENM